MPWGGPATCRTVALLCREQLIHLTGARDPWRQSAGEQGGPLGIGTPQSRAISVGVLWCVCELVHTLLQSVCVCACVCAETKGIF